MNFRKLLLNRCQKEFERDQDDDEFFEKKQKELDASKDVSLLSLLLQAAMFGAHTDTDTHTCLYPPSGR